MVYNLILWFFLQFEPFVDQDWCQNGSCSENCNNMNHRSPWSCNLWWWNQLKCRHWFDPLQSDALQRTSNNPNCKKHNNNQGLEYTQWNIKVDSGWQLSKPPWQWYVTTLWPWTRHPCNEDLIRALQRIGARACGGTWCTGTLVHVQCTLYMLHWYMVHWYSGTVVYGALVQLHHSKHWCWYMHAHQAVVAILQSGG